MCYVDKYQVEDGAATVSIVVAPGCEPRLTSPPPERRLIDATKLVLANFFELGEGRVTDDEDYGRRITLVIAADGPVDDSPEHQLEVAEQIAAAFMVPPSSPAPSASLITVTTT